MAATLAAAIGGPVDIVYDPEPDSPIRSPWRTLRHLLEQTPDDASHRLHIQDDAAVCRNFRAAVEAAVGARPGRLLVFYVGANSMVYSRAILAACERDLPWVELGYAHWCPTVAACWPAGLIPQLLDYVDGQRWPPKFVADDEIVGRFVRAVGHKPLASVPSLVEHPDMVDSIMSRRRNGARRAACWWGDCDECGDAALIDWTAGPG